VRISELLPQERPREKLRHFGPSSLTDVELLAILLRTGGGGRSAIDCARELILRGSDWTGLARMTAAETGRVRGIGPAKRAELQAVFEIARRWASAPGRALLLLNSPEDVARLMVPRLRDLSVEVFVVLALDARNGLRREAEVTRGTLTASIVHPREVFKIAIDERAASIIVVHNHPSGNVEPSREDLEITRTLGEGGRLLGIPLHDHVIVAGDRHLSCAERGYL
jgi:DNA repair protein RadC